MIWSCVGMAYFNAVSTLNLDPTTSLATATLPIALMIAWVLRSRPLNDDLNRR
jgi:hypothetical protein